MSIQNTVQTTSQSPMSALITMFYEPGKTFEALDSKPRGWFPMVVLILSTLALTVWYFSIVDFEWLRDQALASLSSSAEREAAAKVMTKTVFQTSAIGGTVVMFPAIFALMAVYLMIVSKTMTNGLSFGKSFALAAWSSVPTLLLLPLGALQIVLASSGQLSFSDLNPLSLNQLAFHYEMSHPLAGPTDSLNLMTLWSMALLVIGFEVWAKVKRATALKVVLIPYLLFFGVWFAIGLSRAA